VKRPRGPIRSKSVPLRGRVGPLEMEFWYHGHGKPIAPGSWFRVTAHGRELYRAVPEDEDMPKMPGPGAGEAGKGKPRKASQVLKNFKEVASLLTDFTWPDGTVMGNVQLTLRTRGPLVVAQMKLASLGGLRMTVEELCLDDALASLEAALNAEPSPWEPDPYPLDGGGKKRK
jgi:hypothetical protein